MLAACGEGGAAPEGAERGTIESPVSLIPYKGVSLAGAEFGVDSSGNGPLPGAFGVNYMYPDASYAAGYASPAYFLGKGMNTFRLPFRWERLQPKRNAAFDAAEFGRLTTTVNHLTASGATVILDPHNYARYGTALIGSAAVPNADFADLWSRLAVAFGGNPKVLFGLMNEPHDMPTEQWVTSANVAIAAIRAAKAPNLILVPGNGWTGAYTWSQSWYGTPNSIAMLSIQDPGNNFAFEAHQYFDADSGGSNPACVSATVGAERLADFTSWLRVHKRKGFLGEFGAGSSATCLSAIDGALAHIEANPDVYLGWAYWAAGPWWGNHWMIVEPVAGADTKQMTALLPYLDKTSPGTPATCADKVKNGSETGVDCGGPCAPCPSAPPPPAPSSCQVSSYDAMTMAHSTGGPAQGSWNLWSTGHIATNHLFSAGQKTVTVRAHGSPASGVWPQMTVSVGGTPIGSVAVSSANDLDYTFPVAVAPGTHEIRVRFDNDAVSSTEDRNLYVVGVTVGCSASTSTPPPPPPPPAPSSCKPETFLAAAMNHPIGASIPGGWNLWGNGSMSATATFAPGPATVTVRAAGTSVGGVWPHMIVTVGGVPIGAASVTSKGWTDHPFSFTAKGGPQEVRVTFDNDAVSGVEDRNLHIASVTAGCGGSAPGGAPSCTPDTCAASGKTCGAIPDGCGATITCGTCTAPQTCGGAGVANVCGATSAPPPPPAGAGGVRIMPLGDSITLGVNGGYRNGLWSRLSAAGYSVDFVGSQSDPYTKAPDRDHEGHPGFTLGNIASSADGWLSSAKPTHVLLMAGTNDVAWWCAQTASQVADQSGALIDQILQDLPGAWVIVATIPPLSSGVIQPNNVDRAKLASDYDAELRKRVQVRIDAGKPVRLADVGKALTVGDLYDGVHPTEAAADKAAQVWFDALKPAMP